MEKKPSLAIALSIQSKNKKKMAKGGIVKGEADKHEIAENEGKKALPGSSWTDNKKDSMKNEKGLSGSISEVDESPSHSEGETKEQMLARHAMELKGLDKDENEIGPLSIADKIRGKKMADGGMVDLEANSKEDYNHEDDLSFKAKGHEQYDDSQLDAQPEDSNEHGDEHEKALEDHLDMVDAIRKKIKAKKGM